MSAKRMPLSSNSNEDWGNMDELLPFEELAINSGMDSYTQLLTTPLHENHSQSNKEVPIDDEWNTYLNDFEPYSNSVDPLQPDEMPTLEDIYADVHIEDNKTVNMQLNVPVVENAGGEYQNSDVPYLNIDSNTNGTTENNAGDEYQHSDASYLNVDSNTNGTNENNAGGEYQNSIVPYFNMERNSNGTNENSAGGEYQNSNVPYLNIESDTNGTSENVTPCERKISTSPKMNEISDISTQKKRKKSKLESGDKSITNCNCKKSKCLQLYCECFSAGIFCNEDCGCRDCINQEIYEDTVHMEKQRIQSKNPLAFAPKNVRENGASSSGLKKGCKCKQSMCRKKYCECFQAGVNCTIACGCGSCHNPFGIREGSNNIAEGDRMRNLSRLSSGPEYLQLPNNFSSTFTNNVPSLNNQNPDTPTSKLSNGSVHSEVSPLVPDMDSVYELLYEKSDTSLLQRMMSEARMGYYDQQFNFAPQPYVSRPSNQPLCYNNLPYQPSTSTSTSYVREGLRSNPMSDLRGNHLRVGSSSNSMVDLRGNQQAGISQTLPNFTSAISYMNFNGSSAQNGGDHRNVIPYMNSNGSSAQNGNNQRNAIPYMNFNGSSAQNRGDHRNVTRFSQK